MVIEFFNVNTSLGTASLGPDGKVVFSTPKLQKLMEGANLIVPGTFARLTLDDGEEFLRTLPSNFHNAYFYCKRVD